MIDHIQVKNSVIDDEDSNKSFTRITDEENDTFEFRKNKNFKRKQVFLDDSDTEGQDSNNSSKRIKRSESIDDNGKNTDNVYKIFSSSKIKKNPKKTDDPELNRSVDDDIIVLEDIDKNLKNETEKPDVADDDKCFSIHKFLVAMDPEEENYKRRKQIRKIIDDDKLQFETKEAQEMERKRLERLKAKEEYFMKLPDKNFEKIVLDADEKTKEPILVVDDPISIKLKPHQIDGIKFMWTSCYESVACIQANREGGGGCVLAHCMGLGRF
jgi:hypothetical protein